MQRRHFLASGLAWGLASRLRAEPAALTRFPGIRIGTNLATDSEAFAAAGYDFLELPVTRWLVPEADDATFAARLAELRELKLPATAWNGFLPGRELPLLGPDLNLRRLCAWTQVACVRARRARATASALAPDPVITIGSGGARNVPEGFDRERAEEQFVRTVAELTGIAHDEGVVLAVENLQSNETNLGTTFAECLRLVKRVDSPPLRLTADIYHMMCENEGPEVLREAGQRIVHCHIAELAERTQPGVDGDDFRPYFRALAAGGYGGAVTFESSWRGEPAEAAGPAIDHFREQLAEL